MRIKVSIRDVSPDERAAAVRLVERARIILAALDGERPRAIAVRLHLTRMIVYTWLHCFNTAGIAGLEDRPLSSCPPT